MQQLSIGDYAPDFSLPDHRGNIIQLSTILENHNALLVFNIGFAWIHCRNHMAQLRHDYEKFQALSTEVLVMVPNGPFMINQYLKANPVPYLILTDKRSKVAARYFQVKQFFAIGTPTLFIVDQTGKISYAHYATSALEEPSADAPLAVLANLASHK